MTEYENATRFINLFGGLDRINQIGAFGTGKGEWVKRSLTHQDVRLHLAGQGPGIGLAPLGPQNDVMFCAIDLDEPDFDAALEMAGFLPGQAWLERSRSGNAHVWAFFKAPLEAWVARGIMQEAILAACKSHVEVFPKNHDFSKVKYGNYINLPWHGKDRPIMLIDYHGTGGMEPWNLEEWLEDAEQALIEPEEWRKRSRWLMLEPPENRERHSTFGEAQRLHRCAEYIVQHRDDNPVVEGHRAAVYFALAKMFSNFAGFDHDEALMMMELVNESSPDPVPSSELRRILSNAERGGYTSTDCDSPLVRPFADPDCPIANPQGNK